MGKKKKLKFKKRRHISSEQLFKKKANAKLFWMDWSIRQAFPDSKERQEYIQALIKGFEEEKTCEII